MSLSGTYKGGLGNQLISYRREMTREAANAFSLELQGDIAAQTSTSLCVAGENSLLIGDLQFHFLASGLLSRSGY
jgi:hypothetical protein